MKEESAEINCSTHGWRCRLKRERVKEESAEINYSNRRWKQSFKRGNREKKVLISTRVIRLKREREQSAEINCSTHGWSCRLKIENKVLRSTAVLTGRGVDSRERTKC